jgi:hypothetical protein
MGDGQALVKACTVNALLLSSDANQSLKTLSFGLTTYQLETGQPLRLAYWIGDEEEKLPLPIALNLNLNLFAPISPISHRDLSHLILIPSHLPRGYG